MNNNIFCEECNLEFRVKHDASPDSYPIKYCPFCGTDMDTTEESWYEIEEDQEDTEDDDT